MVEALKSLMAPREIVDNIGQGLKAATIGFLHWKEGKHGSTNQLGQNARKTLQV
jgi:hypothetical protein